MCTFLRGDRARADFYRRRKSFLTPESPYLHLRSQACCSFSPLQPVLAWLSVYSPFQRGSQRLWNCNSKLRVNFCIASRLYITFDGNFSRVCESNCTYLFTFFFFDSILSNEEFLLNYFPFINLYERTKLHSHEDF